MDIEAPHHYLEVPLFIPDDDSAFAAALIWQDLTGTGPEQLTIVTATTLVVSLQVLAFPVEEIARVFGQLFGRRQ